MIRVRFAPSPTGMLHIGGARTALFNYIFAKSMGGKFVMRIEDTDKERSTKASVDAILDGMKWLNLNPDEEIVYQSSRYARHLEVAKSLIESGNAYYAYDTKEELDKQREIAESEKRSFRYSGKWRDQSLPKPDGVEPVIRIKVPQGEIKLNDMIKGEVTFTDEAFDDFIIVRSDGTPTYMFAVVVDDIDMKITHVIRGDDHLSNTPKQMVIYNAIGAKMPEFGHLPLIHDESGKKMSKRKNAVAVADYAGLGILPDALKMYLLSLGWSYEGDFITQDEAISRFKISDVGASPSRFDMQKLYSVNLQHIKITKDADLIDLICTQVELQSQIKLGSNEISILEKIMPELKKCNNLNEIAANAVKYVTKDVNYSPEALEFIQKDKIITAKIIEFMQSTDLDNFKSKWDEFLVQNGFKFGQVGPILRSILIGITSSTALTAIISALPKEVILHRLDAVKNTL
ncbi:glutamate--tRNA ligase [Candidatus Deianiraea vastatrix]|uniref:Glutamate--tRNA ligase n=1 Tax=Candidatus Deianiraea vastatrix TaxID=2163644 RepID=A0A5B8XBZ5_9RICK|nr:glutamate--tRNA ligase [Candidatus Deianiraea vastatrix]QED22873.1 Glutamate--tRNA ligase [Candidatus Deianiraea vastatrix]